MTHVEALRRFAALQEAYRPLAVAIRALHSVTFAVASQRDEKFALQAIEDGGEIHEAVHDLLRALWPKDAPPIDEDGT